MATGILIVLLPQIVARAEELNIPICHIWARNYRPETCEFKLEDLPGEIRYKNFPGQIKGVWEKI